MFATTTKMFLLRQPARQLTSASSSLLSMSVRSFSGSSSVSDTSSLKSAFMRSIKGDKGISGGKDSSSSFSEKESEAAPVFKVETVAPEKKPNPPPVVMPPMPPVASQKPAPSFTRRPPALDTNIQEFLPRICVIGVGGAGCNAVNNMIARGLQGVDFICANTDAQHLSTCLAEKKIQIGKATTSGLGCGANPDVGRAAAEESKEELSKLIGDAHMVFITAGMGGGTGTGAAPAVAEICMEKKILTVAVVTKPFSFEGRHRSRLATEGLRALQDRTDTLIVIPNQNLFKLIDQSTSLLNAFALADDVLLAGVKSITDLMVRPGLINLDFADVQAVMSGMGNALMGTGQAEGENRAIRAASDALKNPLLGGDMSIKSAKGMLVNITGGEDVTLFEVDQAAQHVTNEIEDENANIIFGSSFDPSLQGSIRVSVVATGISTLPQ